MAFTLPPLPFEPTALEPHMSAATFSYHHGKHHAAYVKTTNELVAGTPLDGQDLVGVIRAAASSGEHKKLASQSGQIWNHTFFWNSLSPTGGGRPTGKIAELIDRDLGGYEKFAEDFKKEAVGHFASGWGWLVMEGDALKITSLHDGDCPVAHEGLAPLITLDVWEHAYYLDHQNARPAFVESFLANMINWEFANTNLDGQGASRANQR